VTVPPVIGVGHPAFWAATAPELITMNRIPAMSTNWSVRGIPRAWSIH
jgi:hypothetical protein